MLDSSGDYEDGVLTSGNSGEWLHSESNDVK